MMKKRQKYEASPHARRDERKDRGGAAEKSVSAAFAPMLQSYESQTSRIFWRDECSRHGFLVSVFLASSIQPACCR